LREAISSCQKQNAAISFRNNPFKFFLEVEAEGGPEEGQSYEDLTSSPRVQKPYHFFITKRLNSQSQNAFLLQGSKRNDCEPAPHHPSGYEG
jgi:hypothetical protein